MLKFAGPGRKIDEGGLVQLIERGVFFVFRLMGSLPGEGGSGWKIPRKIRSLKRHIINI